MKELDLDKIRAWIEEYEKPSGPDHWVDPWSWKQAMKLLLNEFSHQQDEYNRLVELHQETLRISIEKDMVIDGLRNGS